MPSPLQTWQADIDCIWVERVTDACSWGEFLKLPWIIRVPGHPFRCHYMSWKASYLSCFGSSHYQSGQFSLRDCIEVWGSLLRPLWSVDFRLLWGKWWNIQGAMPVASQVIMTHWRTILPSGLVSVPAMLEIEPVDMDLMERSGWLVLIRSSRYLLGYFGPVHNRST